MIRKIPASCDESFSWSIQSNWKVTRYFYKSNFPNTGCFRRPQVSTTAKWLLAVRNRSGTVVLDQCGSDASASRVWKLILLATGNQWSCSMQVWRDHVNGDWALDQLTRSVLVVMVLYARGSPSNRALQWSRQERMNAETSCAVTALPTSRLICFSRRRW